jgi:hypothetical protein
MLKDKPHRNVLLFIPFVALLILHLIPLLGKDIQLWGVDQWRYVPGAAVFVMLLLGIIVLLSPVQNALTTVARRLRFLVPSKKGKGASRFGFVIPLVLAGLVFWIFRNVTHFLGDGYVWADHILKEIAFNEPAASWMYQSIFKLLNGFREPYTVSPFTVSALISVASGMVFVLFAHKTARLLSGNNEQYALVLSALCRRGNGVDVLRDQAFEGGGIRAVCDSRDDRSVPPASVSRSPYPRGRAAVCPVEGRESIAQAVVYYFPVCHRRESYGSLAVAEIQCLRRILFR